jgi:hypothetical protein
MAAPPLQHQSRVRRLLSVLVTRRGVDRPFGETGMAGKIIRCHHCGRRGQQSANNWAYCVECERALRETLCPPEAVDFRKAGGLVWKDQVSGELQVDIRTWHPSPEWRDRLLVELGKLKHVRRLKVSIGGGYADDLVAGIGDGSSLQELDLAHTRLTDRGLGSIRAFGRLKALDLSGTRVTDNGLVHLAGLPRLSTLSLSATRVTTAGLAHLGGMPTLEALDVRHTNVDDAALTVLGRLPGLRSLSLADTRISDLSMEPLARLASLSSVELQGSLVTADAVEVLRSRRPGLHAQWAPSLKLIGYWSPDRRALSRACGDDPGDSSGPPFYGEAEGEGFFIHPRHLVDPAWEVEERPRIVQYLSDAPAIAFACGMSYCRFGCGWNGSAERSDGVWAWPEGLPHYVQCHDVRLPDGLISDMRARGFRPPAGGGRTRTGPHPSSAYWRHWCRLRLGRST